MIKENDIVKDVFGKVYKVFSINGTTVEAARFYGEDSYGGLENLHITKIFKVVA